MYRALSVHLSQSRHLSVPCIARALITTRLKSSQSLGPAQFLGPIPEDELKVSFARSSGPGGQHANKVSTKADVRFHIESAHWLPEATRERLVSLFGSRVNKDGELVVTSTKTRSQLKNLQDAKQKILDMCIDASRIPTETPKEQKQKVIKLAKKADRKRLDKKKMASRKKQDRRNID